MACTTQKPNLPPRRTTGARAGLVALRFGFLLGFVLVGCGAPRTSAGAPAPAPTPAALRENSDGTFTVVGRSAKGAREALDDAMHRASVFARQRLEKATPLRAVPGTAADVLAGDVHTCTLTFRCAPDPGVAPVDVHSRSAFEQRMRLHVEQGVLTIEEYAQLMAGFDAGNTPP
jgi:hypothetical protein